MYVTKTDILEGRHARRSFLQSAAALAGFSAIGACSSNLVPQRQSSRGEVAKAAMLLPLTGQHAELGQSMAKAVWLVEDTGGAGNRMNILDAGSTPETAASAARQAVAGGAEIVIGPLFSSHTVAVVKAAGQVPVMSLSNDEKLAQAGAWTFGVTPAQSVQAMLRFARSQGVTSLVYQQPTGVVGERVALAISLGARAARVKVATPIVVETSETGSVAALRAANGGKLPDLFYVPGADATAREAAARAQKAGVQTVGSLQWAGLALKALERLEKACFVGPDPARFARLSRSYQARLEQELGILSALAVDAAALAAKLRRKPGGGVIMASRTQSEGLLGRARFRGDKTCERELAVLRIEAGSVRKVA